MFGFRSSLLKIDPHSVLEQSKVHDKLMTSYQFPPIFLEKLDDRNDPSKLRQPGEIPDTDLYFETNLSAQYLANSRGSLLIAWDTIGKSYSLKPIE